MSGNEESDKSRNEKPYKLCEEKLYKLYSLEIENQKYFLSEHQKRVSFYIGLISALVVATVVGVMKSEEWHDFIVLILGPITIIIISLIAILGANRFYLSFLESITTIRKIEHDLGLLKKRNQNPGDENDWAANEYYIPKRYKESTEYPKCKYSDEWVKAHMFLSEKKPNYNGVVLLLFIATILLAGLLLDSIIIIGIIRFFG